MLIFAIRALKIRLRVGQIHLFVDSRTFYFSDFYMNLLAAFFCLFILLLTGCDPAFRIRRDGDHLNYSVPFDCVTTSIKNTPNAKLLSESISSSQYFCKDAQSSRQVFYSVEKETITVTGCYEKDILKTFSQETGGWVGGQKAKDVPAVLNKMREIEANIEKRCNAKGLTSELKNHCLRIECGH